MSSPATRSVPATWTVVVMPVAGLLVALALLLPWNETFSPVYCAQAPCPQPDPETPSGVAHLGPFVVVPLAATALALLRPLWFLLAGDRRGGRALAVVALVLCGLSVLLIGFDILAPALGSQYAMYHHGDNIHPYREPRSSVVALAAAVLSLVTAAATLRTAQRAGVES